MCSKRFPGPSSPPGVPSVTTAVSESSSCGSDSSERLSCYKRQVYIWKADANKAIDFNQKFQNAFSKLRTKLTLTPYSNARPVVAVLQQVLITTILHQMNLAVRKPYDQGMSLPDHTVYEHQFTKMSVFSSVMPCSSESTDHERSQRDRNGERPTTMSGSAIAWELFLWFSCRLSKVITFRKKSTAIRMSTSAIAVVEHNNFIQSSSAKLKTISTLANRGHVIGTRTETNAGSSSSSSGTSNRSTSNNSRGLIRYSFYALVPLSAMAAVFFCKCNKSNRAEV